MKSLKNCLAVLILITAFALIHPTVGFSKKFEMTHDFSVRSDTSIDWYALAAKSYKEEEYNRALDCIDKAIAETPKNSNYFLLKGRIQYSMEFYDAAIKTLTEALGINPKDAEALSARGSSYAQKNEWRNSLKDFEDELLIDPQDLSGIYGRGVCLFYLQQYEKALPDINQYLAKRPETYYLYYQRGIINYSLNHPSNAIRDFNKYVTHSNATDTYPYYFRALSYGKLRVIDSAIADQKRDLAVHPDHTEAIISLGISYSLKKESLKVDSCFVKLMKIDKDEREVKLNWAVAQLNLTNYQEASITIEQLFASGDISAELYLYKAKAEVGLNDTTAALADLARAIKLDSANKSVYDARIEIYSNNIKTLKLVIADQFKLISLESDPFFKGRTFMEMTVCNLKLKDTVAALSNIAQAISLAPDESIPHVFRAMIYLAQRKLLMAKNEADNALKLDGNNSKIYFLRALVEVKLNDFKGSNKDTDMAVKFGAQFDEMQLDYLRRGKKLPNGQIPKAEAEFHVPRERIKERLL